MEKALLISLDVIVITFIVSFIIAVLIKALMSGIKYFFNRAAKRSDNS